MSGKLKLMTTLFMAFMLTGCVINSSALPSNSESSDSSASSSENNSSSDSTSDSSSSDSSSSSSESSLSSESSSGTSVVYETYYVNVASGYPTASTSTDISSLLSSAPYSYFATDGVSISSVAALKIYPNETLDALKFASGKAGGSLALSFSVPVTISSITLSVGQYSADDSVVTVSDGIAALTGTVSSGVTSLDFALGSSVNSSTLTISSPASNRFYLYGIAIATGGSSSSSSSSSSSGSSSSGSSSSLPEGAGFYKATSYTSTLQQLKEETGIFKLGSTGNQKILVIPVQFTDYPCSTLTGGCEAVRTNINKTFFGQSSETGWESVSSYYAKSSYGKLNISGVVAPWYNVSMTSSAFSQLTGSGDYADYFDPTWTAVEQAVAWYKSQTASSLTDYDSNSDGFIDAVWMVYSAPDYGANSSLPETFWAYTYWDYDNESSANTASPVPFCYAWASYDFMWEGGYTSGGSAAVDAHTYIHETGHVLGLDDYYSYTDGDWGAAGGVDMMDYNIVDHNAYSKMALEWTYPYVIDGTASSTTITLNPFESSGDCIIINNSWNGSPLDEYLAIEFYTPTGLNFLDSQNGGYTNGLAGFTVPGVKIYHIDSRLGHFDWSTGAFMNFADIIDTSDNNYYTDLAVSNSSEYSSANANYKLVHLLEAGKSNTFKTGSTASNSTLFTTGKTFTPSSFASFFVNSGKFDDGSAIGNSITVSSVTSLSATVTITKI